MSLRFSLVLVAALSLLTGCTAVALRRDAPPNGVAAVPPAAPAPAVPAAAPPPATAVAETDIEDTQPAAPIRLGLLAPLSGRYASYGKAYLDGARAAAGEHNARAARRVELVPADCTADPLPALQATRTLVEGAGVTAILGSVLNAPTLVAAMEANCRGVPLVSNVATEDGIGGVGPWVFHLVPSRRAAAHASADLAVLELRRFRAAIVYPESGDGRSLALAFAERFAELGGEVVLSEPFADGMRDFAPIAGRIAGADPDVLYAPAEADDWMLLAPALAFHGVAAQIVGTEALGRESLLQAYAADLEGAVLPAPDAAAAPPASLRAAARSQTEERLALAGYAAARRVLVALARHGGDPEDRDGLRDALAASVAEADGTPAALSSRFLVVRSGRVSPLR